MAVDSEEGKRVLAEVREIAMGFPEVSERPSHGTPSFFVREKKVLASVFEDHHGDERIAMWCPAPPGVQAEVVDQEPERFFVPPYVGHRGWIGLILNVDPDWEEVAGILTEAYRLIAPKTLIKLLDAEDNVPKDRI